MRFFCSILALTFTLISCAHPQHSSTATKSKEETTGKIANKITDENLLKLDVEQALGEALQTHILKNQKKLEVSQDFETYTADIAQKLSEHSNRPQIHYVITFLDSKDPIALGLPGGKILISKGFLNLIKSESEFACLIGNQMAHIAKQHLIQNLLKDSEYSAALKTGNVNERMILQSNFILSDLGFDTTMTNEADRLGVVYAMHLGYDPHGLLTLLQRLQQSMEKKRAYGKTDQSFDMINHRTSMNAVFAKSFDNVDRSSFPKQEDRFSVMLKKIKPTKKKK